jgi:glycosyltransferase involved in cell wall biosynthesis
MDIVINGRFLTQRVTGVQRYARELVQALDRVLTSRSEVKITVMLPRNADVPTTWHEIAIRQVGSLQGHAWEQIELPWYSRGKTLFCPGNTAPIISLFGSQPVITTVHDLSYKYFPSAYSYPFRLWYSLIVPLVLRRANAVITVSEAENRAITAQYPNAAPRLHTIANGGLPADVDPELVETANEDCGYVLYVGSLSKRKNFTGAFEAACRLARKRNFHFLFVGGAAKGITDPDVAIPKDFPSNIRLMGQVDDPRAIISYYRRAACLIFPSFYESCGLPPIEAMACGCPVIVSNIPALKERCGDAALYCDPYDVGSITEAIERGMDDHALREKLRLLGYRRAATYTWERCAMQTLDLLQALPPAPSQ